MPSANNFISELMELEDVIITDVEVSKTARHIHIEIVLHKRCTEIF